MEIVLAIALTSVVMYLLMTAIELYMVRVDSSRGRVETAQLARTLLDEIAADLTATRLYAPPRMAAGGAGGLSAAGAGGAAPGAGGGASGGGGANSGGNAAGGTAGGGAPGGGAGGGAGTAGGGGSNAGGGSSAGGGAAAPPVVAVQGVFGELEQLRIDRAAFPNWQRAAREVSIEEPATAADQPASVRYFLGDGQRMSAEQLALQGVRDEPTAETAAGLYREVIATAALAGQSDPLATTTERDGVTLELLAPEVVKLEFSYFDGTQMVQTWDSLDEGGLPAGIEIRLTLYEPSFQRTLEEDDAPTAAGQPRYRENELVEFRRFVRLPNISPAQPADALLPVAGGGGALGGQPVGGPGGGNNGGGPNGGANGGGNNGGRNGANGGGQGAGNDD